MRGACWWAMVALTPLAGCLGGESEDDASPDTSDPDVGRLPWDPSYDFAVPNNGTACAEVAVLFMVPFERAQSLLPPGFTAGDAQALLGSAIPVGRAAIVLTTATCAESELDPTGYSEASVAVTVNAPDVEVEGEATANLYELARATHSPNHTRLLDAVGWERFGSDVQVTVAAGPAGPSRGAVADENGTVYEFTLASNPATIGVGGLLRWWHETTTGLSYFEYEVSADYSLSPASCTIREGTIAHRAAGSTTCPPGDSFAAGGPIPAFTAQFRHLAGVHLG